MSKLRIVVAGLASFAFLLTSFVSVTPALAVDDPTLSSAVAKNTGGTSAKEEDDSIVLTFSEETNELEITEDNVDDIFVLNNGHSFLDGSDNLEDANWSNGGLTLTIILSDTTSLPTVAVGDTITITGDDLQDEAEEEAFTGTVTISGTFGTVVDDDEDEEECEEDEDSTDDEDENDEEENDEEEDEDEDEEGDVLGEDDCDDVKLECNNALKNGKLYKIGSDATVYLAVKHCVLKPFRGAAVFKARGHKFQDVIQLSALPAGVKLSGEPALPVEGTLIKGTSTKTVWFVGHNGKLRGFVSADVFTKLGFKFEAVQEISDSDLSEMPTDTTNVADDTKHPDGSLIKCGNSAAVFLVVGGKRKAFTSAETFQGRGHSFEHILNVDCGRFAYQESTPVTE